MNCRMFLISLALVYSSSAYGQQAALSEDPSNEPEIISASDFLQELEGNFKGSGEAIVGIARQTEKVNCRVSNVFDVDVSALSIKGRCATTQGKTNVEGQLQVKDGKVIGSFLSPNPNTEITKSSSQIVGDKLIISTSMVDKNTGNLSRMRQIVTTEDEGGFKSVFMRFDNAKGSYEETGSVDFAPSR